MNVEGLVTVVAAHLHQADALGVAGAVGPGQGKEADKDVRRGDAVDGRDLTAAREQGPGGIVARDDHPAVDPDEAEGDQRPVRIHQRHQGVARVVGAGIGVTAADRGGHPGQGDEPVAERSRGGPVDRQPVEAFGDLGRGDGVEQRGRLELACRGNRRRSRAAPATAVALAVAAAAGGQRNGRSDQKNAAHQERRPSRGRKMEQGTAFRYEL